MIEKNLEAIKANLPLDVRLIAVSKYQPNALIQEAYEAGQRCFAESRPQEMKTKQVELPKDIEWHFIGHLQTNKIKYIVPFVRLVHSVDSENLLAALSEGALKVERRVDVLLQVHVAREQSKQGFSFEEIELLYATGVIDKCDGVRVVGLMAMASFTDDMEVVRGEFKSVQIFFERLRAEGYSELTELSMGMSSDYQVAVECGSTMVRVGSDIFGDRNY